MSGCVVGPGENPLRPGDRAIQMNRCGRCNKRLSMIEAVFATHNEQYDMKPDGVYGTVVCDVCWAKKK